MCYLSQTIWRTIYIWYLHNICSLCKYYSLPACFPSSKFTSGMGFTSILRLELLLVLLSRVKWFSTFLWFTKSYTFLLIRYIFKRSIKKIRQISPRMSVPHTQQSFHFQKIAGDLHNYEYFCVKICRILPYTIHEKTITNDKIWN